MYTVVYKWNGIVKHTPKFDSLEDAQDAAAEIIADGGEAVVKKLRK